MMMMMNDDDDEYTLSKKRKCKNKRRFSDEQITSLERIFESESRLEPRKKVQVARELGLQPRQVAIWFQNKRARYKTKQLEREYGTLLASYNNLASQFESVKKEKQALQEQLEKLKDQMKSREGNQTDGRDDTKSESQSNTKAESFGLNERLRPNLSLSEHNIGALSDEGSSIKAEYFVLDDELGLPNMVDPADSTLSSPENWGGLESEGLLDQSGSSYQWWDVWS